MVQFSDIDEHIQAADSWQDMDDNFDNFSEASQSMDELLNGTDTPGHDESFFETLDEHALDEMAREIDSDKAFLHDTEDMPKLDSSDVGSMSSDGYRGYIAAGAGLFSGAIFMKAQAFLMRKLSSMRNKSAENDDVGLDEVVDVDDIKNAAANVISSTPPPGAETAA
jgi:hypothetical protein